MKKAIRASLILAAFIGILTAASTNYASPASGTVLAGTGLSFPYGLFRLSGLIPGNLRKMAVPSKKISVVNDRYSHAWKVARYLSTSA